MTWSPANLKTARLALLALLCAVPVRAVASWESLPLPRGAETFVDSTQLTSGELFLATETSVYVRSPYGDDTRWELAWEAPSQVHCIGGVEASNGPGLVVCVDDGLWLLEWTQAPRESSWSVFRYRFRARQIADAYTNSGDRFFTMPATEPGHAAVRGVLVSNDGTLRPMVMADGLHLSEPVEIAAGSGISEWRPGPNGWSLVWKYATATLGILDAHGVLVGELHDLAPLLAPGSTRGNVNITDAWVDAPRSLLFVASDWGLAVADLDPGTTRPIGGFHKVLSVGDAHVKAVGGTLGRLFAVIEARGEVAGIDDVMLLEKPYGRRVRDAGEAQSSLQFEAGGQDGPEGIDDLQQLEDDLLLAVDFNRKAWHWTPSGWMLAPNAQAMSESVLLGLQNPVLGYPVVFPGMLGNQLWVRTSLSDMFWQRQTLSETKSAYARQLVPDPGGKGVWAIEPPPGGMSGGYGYLRFGSPNGVRDSADSTSYGLQRKRFARLGHRLRDGSIRWPLSSDGGLILPMGKDLMHLYGGAWQRLALVFGDYQRLHALTPAPQGIDAAWVGILESESESSWQLVAIDGDPNLRKATEQAEATLVPLTGMRLAQGERTLFPDADGYVWIAEERDGRWTGQRMLTADLFSEPVDLGPLPSGQHPLFLVPDQGDVAFRLQPLVFTEQGFVRIPHLSDSIPTQGLSLLAGLRLGEEPTWRRLFPEAGSSEDAIVFREVFRSPSRTLRSADGSAELPDTGWVLLSDKRIRGTLEASSHYAFEISLADPTLNLRPFPAPPQAGGRPRPVANWVTLGEERTVWSRDLEDADVTAPPWVEHVEGSASSRSGVTVLTGMQGANDAVVNPIAVERSSAYFRPYDLAVLDGERLAFHRFPDNYTWGDYRTWVVPVALTIHDESGTSRTFNVRGQAIPAQLPATTHRVEVTLRPSYAHWWRRGFDHAWMQFEEEGPWHAVSAAGKVGAVLRPDARFHLTLRTDDRRPGKTTEWRPLTFSVLPRPIPKTPLVIATVAALVALLVATVAVSARIRRWLLVRAGRRWVFLTQPCDYEVRLRASGEDLELELLRRENPPAERPTYRCSLATALDGGGGQTLAEIRAQLFAVFRPGENVLVNASESLFRRPWAHWLGDPWSTGGRAVIAGQVTAAARVTEPGDAGRTVLFRGLENGRPSAESGLSPLAWVREELDTVRKQFKDWGAIDTTAEADKATVADLRAALQEVDIIHLAAHANSGWVELADRRFRTDDLAGLRPRCRLIVIRGCELGDPRDGETSLITSFVGLGVNVIAATQPVLDNMSLVFFREFYSALLPAKASAGITLADAVRSAGTACQKRLATLQDEEWRKTLDAYTLYGDPTLHLALLAARRTKENDDVR